VVGALRDLPVHGNARAHVALSMVVDRLVRERCLALAAAPQAAPSTAQPWQPSARRIGVAARDQTPVRI